MGVTMTLLAMFGLPAGPARGQAADAAMEAFVLAMKQRDRGKVAAFFPARLHVVNTLERPYQRAVVDCRRADDLDDLLFGDDGLRDHVIMAGRRPWRRRGAATFVPPYAGGLRVHVRWRREGARMVIHEIALPSA